MSLYRGYFVPGAIDPLGRQELELEPTGAVAGAERSLEELALLHQREIDQRQLLEPAILERRPTFSEIIEDKPLFGDLLGDEVFRSDCQASISNLRYNRHPAVERALECNVNIYCGDCGGAGLMGVAHFIGRGGHAHVCIDKWSTKNLHYLEIHALIVHEMIHVGQFLDSGKCGCKDRPFIGQRPAIPIIGGDTCDECKMAEIPAYQAQAEYIYPKGQPGAAEFHKKFVEAGLRTSCIGPCGFEERGEFPARPPFPLD